MKDDAGRKTTVTRVQRLHCEDQDPGSIKLPKCSATHCVPALSPCWRSELQPFCGPEPYPCGGETMPVERMELKKVCTEADDDSTDSLNDQYTEPIDSEKATINSQFCDEDCTENQKFLTNGVMKRKKYEEYQEDEEPGHTSFGMSVFNLSNAMIGSGILGLSYAMANTGILLFVILLFGVAILSIYSIHLLLVAAKEGSSLIYEKLGERAFGWPGKIVTFGSIMFQNFGAISSYLFIIKYELPEVIRSFTHLEENSSEWFLNGNYLVVIVSLLIIFPLSVLKNLGYLGYTSCFSLACMVFFLGTAQRSARYDS
uniref:Solute carrier family 38 member 4 n=1 Tax=Scleropages formosus TaxID=113540 RepID=A0A8C9R0A6_SCLFO